MKKLLLVVMILVQAAAGVCQAPEAINYQMVIRNQEGGPVANSNLGLRIQLIRYNTEGPLIYSETHTARTDASGLVGIDIGAGEPLTGSFDTIDWSNGPYFLKVETDPAGGSDFTLEMTSQLLSVPFSRYATHSGNGFTGSWADLYNLPVQDGWDQDVSDDFSGNFISLADIPPLPVIYDQMTSSESVWSSSLSNLFLVSKTDSSMVYSKSALQIDGHSILNYDNLIYKPVNLDVNRMDDLLVNGPQVISGEKTITEMFGAHGGIDASDQRITNILTPENAEDAVNKSYMDQLFERITSLEQLTVDSYMYDIEGNKYRTVRIGSQVWMAENLRTKTTKSGNPLQPVYEYAYPNDDTANVSTYGLLYPLYIDVCPSGWHLPTDDEWKKLEVEAGMELSAVDSMGCRGNISPELTSDGNTGFDALYVGQGFMKRSPPLSWSTSGFGTFAGFLCGGDPPYPFTWEPCSYPRLFTIDSSRICRTKYYSGEKTYNFDYYSARCVKN